VKATTEGEVTASVKEEAKEGTGENGNSGTKGEEAKLDLDDFRASMESDDQEFLQKHDDKEGESSLVTE
jgi:hypothetical protein